LCVSQSGCKSATSFLNWQEIFEVFLENFRFLFLLVFLSVCQGTLLVLRGANVTSVFQSHKLFEIFFFENKFSFQIQNTCQFVNERMLVAGAKVPPLFAFTSFLNTFF
jgi:hypothetical protein